MSFAQFLSILSASFGFVAALFFAWGTARATDRDIYEITSMKWNVNQHWADSIIEQRVSYKVGVLFLLVSFALQLPANLIPSSALPSLSQPLCYALAEIVVGTVCLALGALRFRNEKAKKSIALLRKWRAEELENIGKG